MNDWFLSPSNLPQIVFSLFIDPLSSCPLTLEQHVKRSFSFASVNTSDLPGSSKSCSTSPCLETSPSGGFHCFCSQRSGYILPIEGIRDLLNISAAHHSGIGIWESQGWGANKEECTMLHALKLKSWHTVCWIHTAWLAFLRSTMCTPHTPSLKRVSFYLHKPGLPLQGS